MCLLFKLTLRCPQKTVADGRRPTALRPARAVNTVSLLISFALSPERKEVILLQYIIWARYERVGKVSFGREKERESKEGSQMQRVQQAAWCAHPYGWRWRS